LVLRCHGSFILLYLRISQANSFTLGKTQLFSPDETKLIGRYEVSQKPLINSEVGTPGRKILDEAFELSQTRYRSILLSVEQRFVGPGDQPS
jgi:hypothetical protein